MKPMIVKKLPLLVKRIFSTGRAVECNETASEGGETMSVVRTGVNDIDLIVSENTLRVLPSPSPFQSSLCHHEEIFFQPKTLNGLNSGESSANSLDNTIYN